MEEKTLEGTEEVLEELKEKVAESLEEAKKVKEVPEEITLEMVAKALEELNARIMADMMTLNKILSTYEDEINTLKTSYFDLSFKFKQLHAQITPAVSSTG